MLTNSLQNFTIGVALGLVGCASELATAPPPPLESSGGNTGVQSTSTGTILGTGGNSKPTVGGATSTGQAETSGGSTTTGATSTSTTAQNLGGSSATTGTGGSSTGGSRATTGAGGSSTGGSRATGGNSVVNAGGTAASTGGSRATGGNSVVNAGGTAASTGGSRATGGNSVVNAGGTAASTGGSRATGGTSVVATGGTAAASGGTNGVGGGSTSTAAGAGSGSVDPCSVKTMPTGGTVHSATWAQGGKDNLAWQIWSNGTAGSITTFDTTAFSASWNGSNFLGRLGYEWGSNPKAYKDYGTISIDFSSIKSGSSGGQWSYVGVYGWTNNPCIEWYIIEDSFSPMPFNLGGDCYNMSNSPLAVDGGEYIICKRSTSGTGGDRCGGAGNWNQYYSIRKTARTCGTISVTKHFDAWTATGGNTMGKLLEVKILVETGAGSGKVDFPLAKVTATSP